MSDEFLDCRALWFKPETECVSVDYARDRGGLDGVRVTTKYRAEFRESELAKVLREHAQPLLRVAYLSARKLNDHEFMQRLEACDELILSALKKAE